MFHTIVEVMSIAVTDSLVPVEDMVKIHTILGVMSIVTNSIALVQVLVDSSYHV